MSGKVVHFEIPLDDVERGRKFFAEAFGWTINPLPEMEYTLVGTAPTDETGMLTEAGSINGGMFARGAQSPSSAPVITIDVDDIDEALRKIESLGGSTVAPRMPVGDMGFTAYFKDAEGNVLGLWQNAQQAGNTAQEANASQTGADTGE
jgi:hypothetical protein